LLQNAALFPCSEIDISTFFIFTFVRLWPTISLEKMSMIG
jgi:hypothetical protein